MCVRVLHWQVDKKLLAGGDDVSQNDPKLPDFDFSKRVQMSGNAAASLVASESVVMPVTVVVFLWLQIGVVVVGQTKTDFGCIISVNAPGASPLAFPSRVVYYRRSRDAEADSEMATHWHF